MRASTSWRKPLLQTSGAATRRALISRTPNHLPISTFICESCRNSLTQATSSKPLQRRFASSFAAPKPASEGPPQPRAPPQNHYEFFPQTLPDGPPPSGPFHINLRALRKEFLQLQAKAHPDRHPSSLKARAEATSARINEAYKTLQSPLLRAQYCLSLQGINIAEDETAKVQDPELLMAVMEIREAIEEAQEEEDLCELKAQNDERIEESEERIGEAFREGDVEGAKAETVRLRYWVNVKESLDHWEKGKEVVLQH